jgi:hypothetical protein
MNIDWATATSSEICQAMRVALDKMRTVTLVTTPVHGANYRLFFGHQKMCKVKKGPRKGKYRTQVVL